MKRVLGVVMGLAIAVAMAASTMDAQGVTFGLGGGLTVPLRRCG